MEHRNPIVAGQFYPASQGKCIEEIEGCLAGYPVPKNIPENIVAGIVPHAGWVFSGSLAGLVFNCIKTVHQKVDTFIIFGAAHHRVDQAMVFDKGLWSSPLGTIEIDEQLAEIIAGQVPGTIANHRAHSDEHSIEVQIPFIQHLFEDVKIIPIMVPPTENAVQIGEAVGNIIKELPDKKIVCIGSTDLTHYGPRYGFNPEGTGQKAVEWARDVNDKSFIEYAISMQPEKIIADGREKLNACGPGAAAATVAAAKILGKSAGQLLAHTSSNDIMKLLYNQTSDESVGYAAIIF